MATPLPSWPSSICSLGVLLLSLAVVCGASPIASPEERGRAAMGDPLPEQDGDLDARDILNQLLSTLNLTERPSQSRTGAGRKEPPEYMLELYNRFANDHTVVPSANIVRSFKNEDSSLYSVSVRRVRIHPLAFNISVPHNEHITFAELRLYTTLQTSTRRPQAGLDRKVTIYRIQQNVHWKTAVGTERRKSDKAEVMEMEDLEELMTKRVHARDNGWLSFDLSRAVGRWQKSGCAAHRLEVHVSHLEAEEDEEEEPLDDAEEDGKLDIDRKLEGKHNAVMIVFSNDQSRDHKQSKQELEEMVEHENDLPEDFDWGGRAFWDRVDPDGGRVDGNELDKQSLVKLQSNLIYNTPPRIRRNVKNEPCKRTPLFVDFKDIGWDSWVIRPLGYEAYECNGVCDPPMTAEVSPTKHAIVQTLLSVRSPQRASRACCVPTKLEPISLLYQENGVVVFNHKYEGMKVAECGCR